MRLLAVLIPLIAAFVGLIGTVFAGLRFMRPGHVPRPRRVVNYRVHYDDSLGTRPDVKGVAELVVRRHGQDVPDASLVMIRLSNEGGLDVGKEHWIMPINFTFDGRDVVGVEVSDSEGVPVGLLSGGQKPGRGAGGGGLALAEGETIRISKGRKSFELPRIDLRRKERIRLLVLLSGPRDHLGPGVQGDAAIKGSVRGGGLVREVTPGRERFYTFGWTGLTVLSLVAVVLVALIVRPFSNSAASGCVSGNITVEGSTAFAPSVAAVAGQYKSACGSSSVVSVNPPHATVGSLGGAEALQSGGARSATLRDTRLVMSDGEVSKSEFPSLVPHPVAIVIFAIVVNTAAGINSLTQPQLAKIWTGQDTNWNQLPGGADLPIDIVGRTANSGTRATFDKRILDKNEIKATSSNCTSLNPGVKPGSPILCEKSTTSQLLRAVNSIPGAIGYAEFAQAAAYSNVSVIPLNGVVPNPGEVKAGHYSFFAVETLYTYSAPPRGSLLSEFLAYMYTDTAKSILESVNYGDIPCGEDTALCAAASGG